MEPVEEDKERKRCRESAKHLSSPSAEPAQPEQGLVPLNELCVYEILRKLWAGGDETLETLQTCRLVCHDWQELIDKLPPLLHWNPWLHEMKPLPDIFDWTPATILTSDFYVLKFLMNLPNDAPSQNPFNSRQTVKLVDPSGQVKNEEKNLLMIIEKYGHHIKKLLYRPDKNVPEKLAHLPSLLGSMKILQSLIIDLDLLPKERMKKIRGEDFPALRHLKELVIIRERVNDSSHNESETTYAKLAETYGHQIKSITVHHLWEFKINGRNVLDLFPNLEEFKVENLSVQSFQLIQPSGNAWPKLRRLALGIPYCWEGCTEFRNVLSFIRCFSSSLETLSLSARYSKRNPFMSGRFREPDAITEFGKLKELILPFWFMLCCVDTMLEARLRFQFPNLRSIILEDAEGKLADRSLSSTDFDTICDFFWTRVPPSVETISLRTSIKNNGRRSPCFLKCSKNLVQNAA